MTYAVLAIAYYIVVPLLVTVGVVQIYLIAKGRSDV
jgi:hypothetical protein